MSDPESSRLTGTHITFTETQLREGVRRDALRCDGEWIDAITMAVLAPEWT